MREKLRRFMAGRYGTDKMNQVLSVVAIILLIMGIFLRMDIWYFAGIGVLAVIYYRSFSKNISARYQENQAFLRYYDRLTGWFGRKKSSAEQNRGYHIYKCPQCHQKVRVPKGKGKIQIHCPKCQHDFIKRS